MKGLFKISSLTLIVVMVYGCATTHINNGKAAFGEYKYQEAIKNLSMGLAKKEDPEGTRMLAQSYMLTNDFEKACEVYEEASFEPIKTDEDRIEHGKALMSADKYSEAQEIFEGILSREPGNRVAQSLHRSCKNIDDLKQDSSLHEVTLFTVPGLTGSMSSSLTTYGMVISGTKPATGNKDGYTGDSYLDLYQIDYMNGVWKDPKPIDGLNTKYHDGMAVMTADGNTAIFTRSYFESKKRLGEDASHNNNMQLYTSTKDEEGEWAEATRLNFCDEHNMYCHPALSADGNTLYFSSEMQGGIGAMDLYKSTFNGTEWSKPENLGPVVNTPGNEVFPTLKSADSLYYSSDSHKSIGGLDILYSVLIGDEWSEPNHMSYPLNSGADDFGMVFEGGGETGFFSSDRMGSDNLYKFISSNPELVLKGLVTDKDALKPLEGVKITIQNITDGTEEVVYSDRNGQFTLDLLPGKRYKLIAEDDAYFANTQSVDTSDMNSSEDIEVIFEMTPLVVSDGGDGDGDGDGDPDGSGDGDGPGSSGDGGEGDDDDDDDDDDDVVYPVPNIHWDYNKWDIRPDAEPYLMEIVKLFRDNKNLDIVINSHCDCRGGHFFNDQLSKKRARAVVDYLIAKGVPRKMLKSKGYGERQLLNDCKDGVECSEEKHQENRRTEFIVTGKK
jgi:outer membrane protein OmpA-like peptidoglycan-associated protein/tetratricopeptide (TPR) repeat protein